MSEFMVCKLYPNKAIKLFMKNKYNKVKKQTRFALLY